MSHQDNSEQFQKNQPNLKLQGEVKDQVKADSQHKQQHHQQLPLDQKTKKLYYKYCCNQCIHLQKSNKSCVCIVPRSKRKKTIGQEGCQTCRCRGCTAEDQLVRQDQQRYRKNHRIKQSRQDRNKRNQSYDRQRSRQGFNPQNGCCAKCIKALSKNKKSCLCQVPKSVRKTKLPAEGCKLCGCHGCHPRDNQKYQYSSQQYSNYSEISSNSENLDQKNYNNMENSVIGKTIQNEYNLYGPMLGFGIPQRTASYILGRPI